MRSHYTNSTIAVLVIGGIGLLVVVGTLLFPATRSSSTEAERKVFLGYKVKAEQGDATAQFELGCCYADGRGVVKDKAEAVKNYRKAAEQNLSAAQFELGNCYADGRGVAKNVVEAYAWFELTGYSFVDNGVPVKMSSNLAKVMSPQELAKAQAAFVKPSANVAKKMSPEQIAAAQKRTAELRSQIDAKLKSSGK